MKPETVQTVGMAFPRENNIEWLRLLFALQVVLKHSAEHIGAQLPAFIAYFPGVPAFFFVSGFLIYASYLNAPGKRYFENRFLRLFPGLLLVTVGGVLVMIVALGWRDVVQNPSVYAMWVLAQVTIGQAYNPSHFRGVGVGVVNGSLWTITTEILFYLWVPLVVRAERRVRHAIPMLFALSFTIYAFGPVVWTAPIYREKTLYDFLAITPIVWGWMFFTGMLVLKYFDKLQPWFKRFGWFAVPMVIMMFWGRGIAFQAAGNRLGLFYFACYVAVILWFAFSVPYVRLRFDFSYGTYIWHMPLINLLLVLEIPSTEVAMALTLTVAAVSWFFVEKPALSLKRRSLNPVQSGVHQVTVAGPSTTTR